MNPAIQHVAGSLIAAGHEPRTAADLLPRNLQQGYRYFLSLCDGGYTADNFLHFFGLGQPAEHNLLQWNVLGLWKQHFGLDEQSFVFAEDILGTQFLFDVRGNRRVVKMLIPDGGHVSLCANTFEEFLENEVTSGQFNAKPREAAKRFFLQRRLEVRSFTHISCKIPGMFGGSDEATKTIGQYWRRKNERRKGRDDEPEALVEDRPSPSEFQARRSSTKPSTISSTTVLNPCSERVNGE